MKNYLDSGRGFANYLIMFLLSTVLLSACNTTNPGSDKKKEFKIIDLFPESETKFLYHSEAKPAAEFPGTIFLSSLHDSIVQDKNCVFCFTMVLSWREIVQKLNQKVQIPGKAQKLNELNQSIPEFDYSDTSAYKTEIHISGGNIVSKAEFTKTLEYTDCLASFKNKLHYNGDAVEAFGQIGCNRDVEFLYYENPEEYIIQIRTKLSDQELILFNTKERFATMADVVIRVNEKIIRGNEDLKDFNKSIDYYSLQQLDTLLIPKILFDIETNFADIEGSWFSSGNEKFRIDEAWQRTKFCLNECGAILSSSARIKALCVPPEPRKLFFDGPFFVMMRKSGTVNPYFGMWVSNTELMTKSNSSNTQ